MIGWLRRLRARARYGRSDADLRREIDGHRALLQEDLETQGWPPPAARVEASRRLGNVTLHREQSRDVWLMRGLDSVWQDLRYGVRTLRRSPAFTATTIATMVIGVSLSTAQFSTFNGVFLKPWPAEHADELVVLTVQTATGESGGFSLRMAETFATSRSLATVGAYQGFVTRVVGAPEALGDLVHFKYVSAGFFEATGVPMHLGRNFREDETRERADGQPIIISYRLWQREFGGDPDVIGRRLYRSVAGMNTKASYFVVGVTRDGWNGEMPFQDDVWLPLSAHRTVAGEPDPFAETSDGCCVRLIARLAPGVSASRAEDELTSLMRDEPGRAADPMFRVRVTGTAWIDRDPRGGLNALLMLFAGTLAVMLLTGANIAHLQLSRAVSRQREILTRMALGGGRARVARRGGLTAFVGNAAASPRLGPKRENGSSQAFGRKELDRVPPVVVVRQCPVNSKDVPIRLCVKGEHASPQP